MTFGGKHLLMRKRTKTNYGKTGMFRINFVFCRNSKKRMPVDILETLLETFTKYVISIF